MARAGSDGADRARDTARGPRYQPYDTVCREDSASIFSATVLATNETGRALVVTLPPSEDAGPPVSFSYRVESLPLTLFHSDRARTPGVVRCAIGETKRFVVDIQASAFVGGEYQFWGSFADVDAVKPLSLSVRP